jgi:hypothetical protein
MKKLFSLLMIALMAIAMFFVGCKRGNDNPNPSGNMQAVALQGIVTDDLGTPLNGVKVTSGSVSVTSGSDGTFRFTEAEVINKRAVIKFEKNGYFTLTRSGVKQSEMFIKAALYPKGNSDISVQTNFDTKDGATLQVPAGMKVKFPEASIMRADGSAYSGKVKADMLYLDPNNENFTSLMPGGDLAALRTDNSEVMLISWGMTEVTLTDESGKPLQIKSGSKAETTFPIPAGMESNPPATIPLWSFDDTKGIWIEDGVATLKGNVYVGEVTHFSWCNLDEPKKQVIIKGKVVDCESKPVPFAQVFAGQTAIYTNSKGEYSGAIPEQTPVTITAVANGGSDSHYVPGQPGGTTYYVPNLKVPCGEGQGGDPGTYTHIEKGAVKYNMSGGLIAYTFADNGWRFRMDIFDEEGNTTSNSAVVINHKNETCFVGTNSGSAYWYDYPYDFADNPGTVAPSIDEEAWKPYQQPSNITIAGKSCKLFVISIQGIEYRYASWNGLLMMMELNDELILVAVSATLDVPDIAFTKTFNVSWLP